MFLNVNYLRHRSYLAILLILLSGFMVYANTFRVPFFLDDHIWITKNEGIKEIENFLSNTSAYRSCPGRFVGFLTLALNFHFGGVDVTGYHVVNLIIHLLTALLVYAMARLTFRTPYFQVKDQKIYGFGSRSMLFPTTTLNSALNPQFFVPLFAALLFAVHPVQTQAVTYIVQRMASLATFFYLLSLVLYVQARLNMQKNAEGRSQNIEGESRLSFVSRWVFKVFSCYVGSVLSAVLAMKTKEIAFTLPLACALYEVCFFQESWKRRLLYLLPLLMTLPIVPMSVFKVVGETAGVATSGPLLERVEQVRLTDISRFDYLFTQFRVIVTYLRLLVLPVNQNLDYDYPIYTTFFTPPVFLSFLMLVGIFGLAVYLFWRTRHVKVEETTDSADMRFAQPSLQPALYLRLIAFGILWFFLTLAPESSLVPIQDVIVEHRLYLPSVGAFITFSTVFILFSKKFLRSRSTFSIVVGTIIIVSLSFATYHRNNIWRSEVGMWEDVISKSPKKPRALNNLAQALNDAGRPWEAIPILRQVLNLTQDYDKANFNLGRSYILVGQSSAAIPLLQEAIRINPAFYGAYNDLSAALIKDKRYGDAITLLEQNIDHLRNMPQVHFNLGVAYFNFGNPGAARRELGILSRQDPMLASKLANLIR